MNFRSLAVLVLGLISVGNEVNFEVKIVDGWKFIFKIVLWNLNGIRVWYDVSVWIVLIENKF